MRYVLITLAMIMSSIALARDEISLFDAKGRVVAYMSDDLTIYLWGGKPVAYLDRDSSAGFHVYGFSGKHLGWFVRGIVRDHDGNGVCGIEGTGGLTELEPLKGLKELKPLKGLKELPPLRPLLSLQWSSVPCRLLLLEGES